MAEGRMVPQPGLQPSWLQPPQPWSGRDDGPGIDHQRWHHIVAPYADDAIPGLCAFVGFASDEGVRRNQGRVGARNGPAAIRAALGQLALVKAQSRPVVASHARARSAFDVGDVAVVDEDLETGQRRLGEVIARLLDRDHFPVVLGGGHEVAFGSFLGLVRSRALAGQRRLGVLNLDAHFDLRRAAEPSSGTPFLQMAEHEAAQGRSLNYAVIGISQPSNTAALFGTAEELGVRYLLDEKCGRADGDGIERFVADFTDTVDVVYLSIDLDVLSASVAPGVSAPATFGVPLESIARVCDAVTAGGKLALCDIAELNPAFDIDHRTARAAAWLIHRVVSRRRAH